jgi:predicted Rossmann fold nucleotide-binding protein DprA/Smf involved in DNA uptake
VESADDIISELGGALAAVAATVKETQLKQPILDQQETELLRKLGFEPVDLDSLARETSLPVEKLSELLVGLELKGIICNENGFYQRLT